MNDNDVIDEYEVDVNFIDRTCQWHLELFCLVRKVAGVISEKHLWD